jgi:hypothetical protein
MRADSDPLTELALSFPSNCFSIVLLLFTWVQISLLETSGLLLSGESSG